MCILLGGEISFICCIVPIFKENIHQNGILGLLTPLGFMFLLMFAIPCLLSFFAAIRMIKMLINRQQYPGGENPAGPIQIIALVLYIVAACPLIYFVLSYLFE